MPAGQHVVDAALHQPPHVEVVGVEERRDRDPKHVGSATAARPAPGRRTRRRLPACVASLRTRRVWRDLSTCSSAALPAPGTLPFSSTLRSALPAAAAAWRGIARSTPGLAARVNVMPLARRSRWLRASMNREQRDDPAAAAEGIAQAMAIRMGARQRHEIVFAKQPVGLPSDLADHVGKRDPPLQVFRQRRSAPSRWPAES